MDEASRAMEAGVKIVIIALEGIQVEHSFRMRFKASKNEAEYKALLVGLKTVLSIGARDIEAYSDSRMVVNQVQGSFEARDSRMKEYLQVVKRIMGNFSTQR